MVHDELNKSICRFTRSNFTLVSARPNDHLGSYMNPRPANVPCGHASLTSFFFFFFFYFYDKSLVLKSFQDNFLVFINVLQIMIYFFRQQLLHTLYPIIYYCVVYFWHRSQHILCMWNSRILPIVFLPYF